MNKDLSHKMVYELNSVEVLLEDQALNEQIEQMFLNKEIDSKIFNLINRYAMVNYNKGFNRSMEIKKEYELCLKTLM